MGNEQSTLSVGNEGIKRRWLVLRRSKSALSLSDDSKKARVRQDNDNDEHITYEKGLGRMPEHVVSDVSLQDAHLVGLKVVKRTSSSSSKKSFSSPLKLPTWTVPVNPTPNDIWYTLYIANNCNCGSWCIDMAKDFPSSQFIGCHWKAAFSDTITPYNCTLQVADPTELPFEEDTFDFVYQRYLQGPFMDANTWPKLFAEVHRIAKPGAYIEFVQPDYTFFRCGPASSEIQRHIMDSVRRFGIDTEITANLESYFASGNLQNINMTYLSFPIGAWAGSIGKLLKADFAFQLSQANETLLNSIHVDEEEFEQLKERVLHEVEEYYTVWAEALDQEPAELQWLKCANHNE
ncbi:hypothetical protein BC937DRAFT_89481 [Endogone sp. FLAS-F59071]|nr:hypothetical protein BC937DRAFT_89481 [Endogone sp. FLAS-F59071]|eukprot:RUS17799.1 hypothetical protein BC937DRAFT_89481 [Endogone sp. FLAS-F59071]